VFLCSLRERVLVYFVHILLLLFGLDNVFVMRFVIEAFQDWRQSPGRLRELHTQRLQRLGGYSERERERLFNYSNFDLLVFVCFRVAGFFRSVRVLCCSLFFSFLPLFLVPAFLGVSSCVSFLLA